MKNDLTLFLSALPAFIIEISVVLTGFKMAIRPVFFLPVITQTNNIQLVSIIASCHLG